MKHKALNKAKTFKIQHEFHKSSHDSISSAVLGKFRQPKLRQLSLTGLSQQPKELHGFSALGFSWLRRLRSPLAVIYRESSVYFTLRWLVSCPLAVIYRESSVYFTISWLAFSIGHPQCNKSRNAKNVLQNHFCNKLRNKKTIKFDSIITKFTTQQRKNFGNVE